MENVERIAPGLMKQFSDQVNNVAQQRIQQILDQGGQKIEKIAPKIIPGAIEDVYQSHFGSLAISEKRNLIRSNENFGH